MVRRIKRQSLEEIARLKAGEISISDVGDDTLVAITDMAAWTKGDRIIVERGDGAVGEVEWPGYTVVVATSRSGQ